MGKMREKLINIMSMAFIVIFIVAIAGLVLISDQSIKIAGM